MSRPRSVADFPILRIIEAKHAALARAEACKVRGDDEAARKWSSIGSVLNDAEHVARAALVSERP